MPVMAAKVTPDRFDPNDLEVALRDYLDLERRLAHTTCSVQREDLEARMRALFATTAEVDRMRLLYD